MAVFTFDDATLKLIEGMKRAFGVTSNEDVISRALALAKVVTDQADEQTHTVQIEGRDDTKVEISLIG